MLTKEEIDLAVLIIRSRKYELQQSLRLLSGGEREAVAKGILAIEHLAVRVERLDTVDAFLADQEPECGDR